MKLAACRRPFAYGKFRTTMHYKPLHAWIDADDSFSRALVENGALLRSYARRLTRNPIDADDLFQDTMLRCWSSRNSFQPESNFRAWSRIVMRNSFLSGLRRARFHADLPQEAFDYLLSVEGGQDRAMQLHDIRWAVEQLSSDHRAALMLSAQGMSVQAAAQQLGVAEGTFKSRAARARTQMRKLIEGSIIGKPPVSDVKTNRPRGRKNLREITIG